MNKTLSIYTKAYFTGFAARRSLKLKNDYTIPIIFELNVLKDGDLPVVTVCECTGTLVCECTRLNGEISASRDNAKEFAIHPSVGIVPPNELVNVEVGLNSFQRSKAKEI